MIRTKLWPALPALSLLAVAGWIVGCVPASSQNKANSKSASAGQSASDEGEGHEHADHDHAGHDHAHHDHSEWWCAEHGMPEEVCAQCNSKLAASYQKKGDWCEEHDRPDSQCFICHPELESRFAAQYEAKYGKKPPPRHAD